MTDVDRTRRRPPRAQRHTRRDSADAFFPESSSHTSDTLAENLAEEYLESATSGEERGEEALNELVAEELGGPFVEVNPAPESDEELPSPRAAEPGRRASRRKRH